MAGPKQVRSSPPPGRLRYAGVFLLRVTDGGLQQADRQPRFRRDTPKIANAVPFQLDPARGSAQRACDWLWGGIVENWMQIVGTALEERSHENPLQFPRSGPFQ